MASYSTNEFKSGLKVLLDGNPCEIVENEFVKPGKGQAFNRTKFKNIKTGQVLERTLKSGDTLPAAEVFICDAEFIYRDGNDWIFMNTGNHEQYIVQDAVVSDARKWIIEQMVCKLTLLADEPLAVTPPNIVDLEVIETNPGAKGDTVTNATKPAQVITGSSVQVPLFINTGDILKIDTRTGEYLSRSKS